MHTILLQNVQLNDSLNNIPQQETLSIIELITSVGTGGAIIMSTLGLLSIYAVYILFERYSAIKYASKEDEEFFNNIKEFVLVKI